MKRAFTVVSAMLLGQMVMWFSAYYGNRIDWPKRGIRSGCWDIEHCDVPWYVHGILVAFLFGPPLVYGAVALVGLARDWPRRIWAIAFAILVPVTVAVYAANYYFNS